MTVSDWIFHSLQGMRQEVISTYYRSTREVLSQNWMHKWRMEQEKPPRSFEVSSIHMPLTRVGLFVVGLWRSGLRGPAWRNIRVMDNGGNEYRLVDHSGRVILFYGQAMYGEVGDCMREYYVDKVSLRHGQNGYFLAINAQPLWPQTSRRPLHFSRMGGFEEAPVVTGEFRKLLRPDSKLSLWERPKPEINKTTRKAISNLNRDDLAEALRRKAETAEQLRASLGTFNDPVRRGRR